MIGLGKHLPLPIDDMTDLAAEFASDLGDLRRTERLIRLGTALAKRPTAPFPSLLDEAELEGCYRLMNSDEVDEVDLFHAHRERTAARARDAGVVLALHDTTQFSFPLRDDDRMRDGLERVGLKTQGFKAHMTLLVSGADLREPLGVVACRPYVRRSKLADEHVPFWEERGGLFANESQRWLQNIEETERRLTGCRVIHVGDRESDQYGLLAHLVRNGLGFVFRHRVDRNLADGSSLLEALESAPECAPRRSIRIGRRSRFADVGGRRKAHPPREARDVELQLTATTVTLQRALCAPADLTAAQWKEVEPTLTINIVRAREVNPPEDEQPVDWILMTSEPIDTPEVVERVVDIYRTRWLIEEYFKAIKSGCAYEKRQSESASALLKVLSVTLPNAWRLLRLRYKAVYAPQCPARDLLSGFELTLLKHMTPKYRWPDGPPTAADALWAIAMLGGHQKRRGPPGWIVLGRGFRRFLQNVEGANAMRRLMEAQDVIES